MAASSSNNNFIKNIIKDSSLREKDSQRLYESRTSDIKEEIFQDYDDEDAYEPVNHNEEEF
jgi:hypothetical protein